VTTKSQAQQQIKSLSETYRRLSESDRATLSEANVVHQFVEPLLTCFTNSRPNVILSASSRQARPEGEIFLFALLKYWTLAFFVPPEKTCEVFEP
jgi:hypothetical protein